MRPFIPGRQSYNISSGLLLKRTSLFYLHKPLRNAFHTSPRLQFLDACLCQTHTLIVGLHTATGLSWAVVLPLTAFLLRFVAIAPITTYVHITNRRRLERLPLIQQWTKVYRNQVMKDHAAEGPIACQKLVRRKLLRKTSELYSKSGTQRWKSFLGYLQIPVWLMVIETIRRMCGDREGFLGMIRNRFFGSQSGSTLNYQEDMSKLQSPETDSETMGGMDMISSAIGDIPEGVAQEPLIPLEPALATEGMLWFPNLLLPDPNLMLSFVLSGSLLANIFYQERYSRKRGWMPGPIQRGFGHGFKIAALAVGPLTLSFPSAIHLYLISSSLFGLANTILLKTFLPIPTTFQTTKPEGSHDHDNGASIKWKREGRQMPANRRRRERKRHQA